MSVVRSSQTAPLFLCIGDIDVDVLIGVDRLPTRDGKVNAKRLQRVPGGMGGNVAAALSRLGAKVRIVGRVGDDEDGAFALAGLDRADIDTSHVVRLAGEETFVCIGLITPDGEKSLIKLMTPAYMAAPEDLTPAALRGVAHAHLTSCANPVLCRRLVELAHAEGATCSLDIETADLPADPDDILCAIQGVDLLFCNSEARAALDRALPSPLASLVETVVTTLGAQGSQAEVAGERIEAPGFAVQPKDTTGAGDCFAGAFLHARMVQGIDWQAALRFANCAAALSTTGYGAQSALPRFEDVQERLRL
jgi:sugar/nucleoside kinase (ribokinase family)